MEHAPAAGEQPLDPPDAATAQAYLDELPGVRQRREVVLDRSRLARLSLVEGVALAVFLGTLLWTDLLGRAAGAPSSSAFGLLAVLFLWNGLCLGIRERYGARQGPRGVPRVLGLVLFIAATLWAVVLIFAGTAVPAWWRIGPALLALASGVWPAIALSRSGSGTPRPPAPAHAVMTRPGRGATLVVGALLSVTAVVTGGVSAGDTLASNLALVCGTIAILAIALCSRMGFVSELGAMWRPPQWIAFGAAAILIAAVMVLASASPPGALMLGLAAAGAVLALFVTASLWPAGRDA